MFRYPGGKSKLKSYILKKLREENDCLEYREPFFGGGSIGLNFIFDTNIQIIWINDLDPGISAIWTSVIDSPENFINKITQFVPSLEKFHEFKKDLLNSNCLDLDLKKIAVHQMSYSGLGTKGGPLGGLDQKSQYKIGCRWNPKKICEKIVYFNKKFKNKEIRFSKCTNFDFSFLIEDFKYKSLIYLDPPYFDKGDELYQFSFSLEDHKRLSELLKFCRHKWLLSYDDCKEIRTLYNWAKIEEINVNYTINTSRNKKELLIHV